EYNSKDHLTRLGPSHRLFLASSVECALLSLLLCSVWRLKALIQMESEQADATEPPQLVKADSTSLLSNKYISISQL
ncbi:hypothetical protein MHYP_G00138450, partial [Metynnis hypsauchen]